MALCPKHNVQIEGAKTIALVAAHESILEGTLRAGFDLPHDCTMGGCGTCRIKLLRGTVTYPDPDELPFGLAPEEAASGYALACQARPSSDLLIEAPRVETLPGVSHHRAMVRSVQIIGPDLIHWAVEVQDAESVGFVPGQYMNVLLEDGARSFSMASAPATSTLDFYARRIAGGRFTDGRLGTLQPGEVLDVELPLGTFVYHPKDDRPLIMVATGTGIAPIKSIIESLLDDPFAPPLELYWGLRSEADLFLQAEILAWAKRLPEFRYIPVLSRAGAGWGGRRGRVQDAVVAHNPGLSTHAIYLCGSPEMIVDAKQSFLAHGASADHLYAEGFVLNSAG